MNCEERAKEFLRRVCAEVIIDFVDCSKVQDWDDNSKHNNYRVTVIRGNKMWTYMFHDSVHNTALNKYPTTYDVLSCVEQYDPGTIDDFYMEFGYEVNCWDDVRRIERIYKGVCEEAANFQLLFGDVADEFAEVFA